MYDGYPEGPGVLNGQGQRPHRSRCWKARMPTRERAAPACRNHRAGFVSALATAATAWLPGCAHTVAPPAEQRPTSASTATAASSVQGIAQQQELASGGASAASSVQAAEEPWVDMFARPVHQAQSCSSYDFQCYEHTTADALASGTLAPGRYQVRLTPRREYHCSPCPRFAQCEECVDGTSFTDPQGAGPDRAIHLVFVTGLRVGEPVELFLCVVPGYEWAFRGHGESDPSASRAYVEAVVPVRRLPADPRWSEDRARTSWVEASCGLPDGLPLPWAALDLAHELFIGTIERVQVQDLQSPLRLPDRYREVAGLPARLEVRVHETLSGTLVAGSVVQVASVALLKPAAAPSWVLARRLEPMSVGRPMGFSAERQGGQLVLRTTQDVSELRKSVVKGTAGSSVGGKKR